MNLVFDFYDAKLVFEIGSKSLAKQHYDQNVKRKKHEEKCCSYVKTNLRLRETLIICCLLMSVCFNVLDKNASFSPLDLDAWP